MKLSKLWIFLFNILLFGESFAGGDIQFEEREQGRALKFTLGEEENKLQNDNLKPDTIFFDEDSDSDYDINLDLDEKGSDKDLELMPKEIELELDMKNETHCTFNQLPGICKIVSECDIKTSEEDLPQMAIDCTDPLKKSSNGLVICCPLEESIELELNFKQSSQDGSGSEEITFGPQLEGVTTKDGILMEDIFGRSKTTPIPSQFDEKELQSRISSAIDKSKEDTSNSIIFQDEVPKDSPEETHQFLLKAASAENIKLGQDAEANIQLTLNLIESLNLTEGEPLPDLSTLVTTRQFNRNCPRKPRCFLNQIYRTIDGSCNNLQNTDWGMQSGPLQRILQPTYGDGINSPRISRSGRQLPSARLVSSSVVPDINQPLHNFTLLLMQWGQFIDHDMTHVPVTSNFNRSTISCCINGQFRRFAHGACLPIPIPQNDPFYSRFRQSCMEFVRSLPAQRRACDFGPREQMNQVTSFLDASHIYGSTLERANSIRLFRGGRLLVQTTGRFGRSLLPSFRDECIGEDVFRSCFKSGDLRTNEQVNLAILHTIFLREHNRVVENLQNLNPFWSDETLYQEGRRIVGAEIQQITYNEFLPLILGQNIMNAFGLNPESGLNSGPTKKYDANIDPTITNVFSAAGFRFGHTLVPGVFESIRPNGFINRMGVQKAPFSPFDVQNSIDNNIRGMTSQNSQNFDNFVTNALTNHLFEGRSFFGLDLISLNLQRGRDHGIPGYTKWREICGLTKVTGWNDLGTAINPNLVQTFRNLYTFVEDIDLFIGAIAERPMAGAVLGPTLICIVGDQFVRLRRADRYYFEEESSRFTNGQLGQLRKANLARILCDNGNQITQIQPRAMVQASNQNPRMNCNSNSIQSMDLSHWRQTRPRNFG